MNYWIGFLINKIIPMIVEIIQGVVSQEKKPKQVAEKKLEDVSKD